MRVRNLWRLVAAAAAMACVPAASAQTFNQELNRYRFARQACAAALEQRLERPAGCVGACLTAATVRRDRCLAAAERRYAAVLRRELRSHR